MKSMTFKKILLILIMIIALVLFNYTYKTSYAPYSVPIICLLSVFIKRMLGITDKKVIMTRKKIILIIGLAIVTYILLANMMDLRLANSIKNI